MSTTECNKDAIIERLQKELSRLKEKLTSKCETCYGRGKKTCRDCSNQYCSKCNGDNEIDCVDCYGTGLGKQDDDDEIKCAGVTACTGGTAILDTAAACTGGTAMSDTAAAGTGSAKDTKEMAPFTLSNGAQVRWSFIDCFASYTLECVKPTAGKTVHDDPWSMMTPEEAFMVEQKRPVTDRPCSLDSIMTCHFINMNDVKDRLLHALGHDCWGILSTTADRKTIVKVYFDARNAPGTPEEVSVYLNREIDRIYDNGAKELVKDIEQGLTVIIVFGEYEFLEEYYFQVPGGKDTCAVISVDHTPKQ